MIENLNIPENVKLIAVTKNQPFESIVKLADEDIYDWAENRVENLLERKDDLKNFPQLKITWHLIGTLQTKKVKKIINEIDYFHALENIKQAEQIEKYRNDVLPCFVQVNTTSKYEDTKHGLLPAEVIPFLKEVSKLNKIQVIGLMTMASMEASINNDEEKIRESFNGLKKLQEEVQKEFKDCSNLSMGMSSDYEIAIECGATHVRLGTILFK